jgi:hypothetical protein
VYRDRGEEDEIKTNCTSEMKYVRYVRKKFRAGMRK